MMIDVHRLTMTYDVWCSVNGCGFEAEEVEKLDRVFDMQDTHTDHYGNHHMLEFEREEASLAEFLSSR